MNSYPFKKIEIFNGFKYCGKNASSYDQIIEIGDKTRCPKKYVKCEVKNSAFICVKSEKCPINYLELVNNSDFNITKYNRSIPLGLNQSLIFSSEMKNTPINKIKIEMSAPCNVTYKVS